MNKYSILLLISSALLSCNTSIKKEKTTQKAVKKIGTLEVVAEMNINPGNVAVSKEGRIFSSIHPLRSKKIQLVEITNKTTYVPFPNLDVQSTLESKSDEKLDTPLGIIFDTKNRLWVIDIGLNIGKTRLYAYDINTRKKLFQFDIPQEIAPSNSFVQDLAVDDKNGFVYLADFGNPGIIVVNIKKNTFRKIVDLPSMQAENIDMIIDGKVQQFMGKPARIGLDPITLSADRETLYYGAMNGTKWYQIPTSTIRNNDEDRKILKLISVLGKKPISDGAATDNIGNHYFTNIQNYSIDVLLKNGKLNTLKKDSLLNWADNIAIHNNWLYIATNQLHKSPAFTGNIDKSKTPFRILRLKYK